MKLRQLYFSLLQVITKIQGGSIMNTSSKDFTIHIHGTAKHEEDDKDFTGIVDFDQLVNLYFRSNKDKFEKILSDIGGVKDKSFLYDIRFDSVDKEIR